MLNQLNNLKEKYIDNQYIDIKNITFGTRYTKSRFGSCNSKTHKININLDLIHYDKKFLEYIFLHEITHINVQNHSKDFYTLFNKLSPNYKQTRLELKNIYRSR